MKRRILPWLVKWLPTCGAFAGAAFALSLVPETARVLNPQIVVDVSLKTGLVWVFVGWIVGKMTGLVVESVAEWLWPDQNEGRSATQT